MIEDRMRPARLPAHWVRFRRLTGWMAALGAALALGVLAYLRVHGPPMPWQARLAAAAGVFMTMLVTGGLMGLVFTSARGGHDAAVEDRAADE